MYNCARKVLDSSLVLTSKTLDIEIKKDNLKNIIINYILESCVDYNPSTDTNVTMVEIINTVEKRYREGKNEYYYCYDILYAIVKGMELIQDSHIDLIKSSGKDRISEPIYEFNKDGILVTITIRSRSSMYKTLLQVSRYFDKKFMNEEHKRTLKI